MKKLYYSMAEASEIIGAEAHTIRYWEKQFDGLKPRRNASGKRIFVQEEITLLLKIKELVHEKRFSIAGAREELARESGNGTVSGTPLPVGIRRDLAEIRLVLTQLLEKL